MEMFSRISNLAKVFKCVHCFFYKLNNNFIRLKILIKQVRGIVFDFVRMIVTMTATLAMTVMANVTSAQMT